MPTAIPFLTLAVAGASAAGTIINGADANGEAAKQAASQTAAQNALLAQQQTQETNLTNTQTNDSQRDAQLNALQTNGAGVTYSSAYAGPSAFGSGFQAPVNAGGKLTGL